MKQRFDGLVGDLLKATFFLEEAVEVLEHTMIAKVLQATEGNQSQASKLLGIHRNTLKTKMAKYQLTGRQVRRKPVARAAGRARKRAAS